MASALPLAAAPSAPASLAARLATTIATARALARNGRRVDLAGLEDGIGQLCARTLDLPHAEARAMRPTLLDLLRRLEDLAAELRGSAP